MEISHCNGTASHGVSDVDIAEEHKRLDSILRVCCRRFQRINAFGLVSFLIVMLVTGFALALGLSTETIDVFIWLFATGGSILILSVFGQVSSKCEHLPQLVIRNCNERGTTSTTAATTAATSCSSSSSNSSSVVDPSHVNVNVRLQNTMVLSNLLSRTDSAWRVYGIKMTYSLVVKVLYVCGSFTTFMLSKMLAKN